jgi:hypothetical protein
MLALEAAGYQAYLREQATDPTRAEPIRAEDAD